ELSQCDLIFGCMDSVDGRHILNKVASYYLIPYIDMGVRIDADGKGGIDSINGAVHYIQPGGSSLLSRGIYTQEGLDAAMMHRYTPELYKERAKQGYIKGVRVDQPAVISVNMHIASLAFNEFLARINPFRVEPNSNYAQRRIVISDPEASVDLADGESCRVFVTSRHNQG
ncbi:MAG: ThiF family adenylyltransferase, partial [Leptothrix ochracea]